MILSTYFEAGKESYCFQVLKCSDFFCLSRDKIGIKDFVKFQEMLRCCPYPKCPQMKHV